MKTLSTDSYHDLPYMTQDEARHLCSSEQRLLIAVENYWYDVSRFSRVHPGGEEVLQYFIADDATQPFLALHSARVLRNLHPIARYCRRPLHLADYEFEQLAIEIQQSGMCHTSLSYMIHQSLIILTCFLLFLICLLQYSHIYIQFIGTVFLYLFFQQSLLTMHNAEHRLLTYNRHIDSHIGRLVGSLFSGVSARWWRDEHFLHHIITNVFDVKYNYFDRQMKEDAWAQTIHLFPCYRQNIIRFIIPYQKWILYPLCIIFGRLVLCIKSIFYSNNTRIDQIMLSLHWIGLWTLLLVYLPTWQYALLFLAIVGWLEGILHITLVTSHYTCDTHDYTQFKEIGWYRRQVATCLDIKPSYPILQSLHSWFFGGLDLHLVHHLFPRLSPEYYLQVTEIVKGICIRHCLPYQSAHMIDAQRLLFDRLSTMSTLFSLDPR